MMMVLAMLVAQAATETYGLTTFEVPEGKRIEGKGNVQFADAGATTFCQTVISGHFASLGDAAKDFEWEWTELVKKPYKLRGERQSGSSEWPGGWTLTLGIAPVSVEGVPDFASLLAVFTGHGVRVAVLINTNDDERKPKIDKFLNSIRLAKPPPPAAAADAKTPPSLKGRVWYRYSSQYSNWGYNPTPMEINKIGNEGHSRWQYRFEEDGSYTFKGEHYSMNRPKEYWFHEEKGTYERSGDTLRLAPKEARRILRDKEGKNQAEPADIDREPASYQVRFHFIAATGVWNLILSPDGGKETKRDGWWSPAPDFPKSYFYGDPPPTPAASGALPEGFAFSPPEGWIVEGAWHVFRKGEGGNDRSFRTAFIRFPPSIGAGNDMGAALRELWKQVVPAELAARHSSMVYRRYLGDGLHAQFIHGLGREKDRRSDSLYSLYLIDLGSRWQPMVVAQTYDDPDMNVGAIVERMASSSYGDTARFAETFLATLRCPSAKGRALVSKEALVGDYSYGFGTSLQWENIYTGATTMTAVSGGGTLDLKADGSYAFYYGGASGVVGAQTFGSEKHQGAWELQGDLLLLSATNGKARRYRVAGLTAFSDGVKVAVLLSQLDAPVNAVNCGDRSDWHSTKKK